MYLADYHVHSRVSPDASASMAEMAEAAIRQGLHELCFTDHVEPIRFGTTEPRADYDWAPMAAEFAAARAAAGDRIQLRLGAELGDAVWGTERMEAMLAKAPELDFTIGSIHTLSEGQGGRDLYFLSPKDEGETRACLADYLGQVRKLAEAPAYAERWPSTDAIRARLRKAGPAFAEAAARQTWVIWQDQDGTPCLCRYDVPNMDYDTAEGKRPSAVATLDTDTFQPRDPQSMPDLDPEMWDAGHQVPREQ